MPEIIRAYLLEKGDIFQLQNVSYYVQKIEEGVIYYGFVSQLENGGTANHTMGAKSREKILLITNKNDKSWKSKLV